MIRVNTDDLIENADDSIDNTDDSIENTDDSIENTDDLIVFLAKSEREDSQRQGEKEYHTRDLPTDRSTDKALVRVETKNVASFRLRKSEARK